MSTLMQSYVFFQSWLVLSADPSVVIFVNTHVFIDSSPTSKSVRETVKVSKNLSMSIGN